VIALALASSSSPAKAEVGRAVWLAVLGPPVLWILRIVISYVLVPYACAADTVLPLHLVTLAALGGIGWIGWRAWSAGAATAVRAGRESGERHTYRFLALFGLGSCAFFFLVVSAEGLMNALIHPCLA
jgi:hypothetical protein